MKQAKYSRQRKIFTTFQKPAAERARDAELAYQQTAQAKVEVAERHVRLFTDAVRDYLPDYGRTNRTGPIATAVDRVIDAGQEIRYLRRRERELVDLLETVRDAADDRGNGSLARLIGRAVYAPSFSPPDEPRMFNEPEEP